MKTAIITGGTRGIGRGILKELANNGINIATCYHHDEDSAKEIESFLKNKNINFYIEKLDVTNLESIKEFIHNIADRFHSIDYLINNIGTDVFKTIDSVSYEEWKFSQDIILNAPFYFCKEVLPYMRKNAFGRIINIGASSKDYMKGTNGLGPFGIHKGALNLLTKTLALEEVKNGITVNMVAPGSTKNAGTNPEEKRIPISSLPLGRRIEIEEIVEAINYFLSENAGSVTGQFIGINGGCST